jgi:hypothetical protein
MSDRERRVFLAIEERRPDERISLQQFRWFNAERQISWQPRNKVEVSEADRATSQTILKGQVRRAKKAVSIRMAVVRNKADLIRGVPPSRADRRVRQVDPAVAPVTLQTTRRRPARRERKAANNPTAISSAFRVVRAGLAPLAPLFFLSCYRCPTDQPHCRSNCRTVLRSTVINFIVFLPAKSGDLT